MPLHMSATANSTTAVKKNKSNNISSASEIANETN